MNNYGYLIVLVTIVSIVMGQQRFIEHRPKSKFRPRPEWFSAMLPEQRPVPVDYDEQSDQPSEPQPYSPFQDFILDDFEGGLFESTALENRGRLSRNLGKEPETFQNLCPQNISLIDTEKDPRFDHNFQYWPRTFFEYTCTHPYKEKQHFFGKVNQVCHDGAKGSCIQSKKTLHFLMYPRTRIADEDIICGKIKHLIVNTSCDCMWRKHAYGDILHAHINFGDE